MDIQSSDLVVRIPGRTEPLFKLRSMDIPFGSRILIHGPSGKGKTTLLHLLSGQFLPDEGDIKAGGQSLKDMGGEARRRLRRRHYGIIFQRLNLFPHLDALENALLGQADGLQRKSEASRGYRNALAALDRMGLGSQARQRCGSMSPGEQQRVAVARVVAAAPDIILADEPTSSLDKGNAETVMHALCDVSEGRTLVVVSHDDRIHAYFKSVWDFADLVDA